MFTINAITNKKLPPVKETVFKKYSVLIPELNPPKD